MSDKIPDYYAFLTWYDLDTPYGVYNFVQEMILDGIDLNKYPDVNVYYNVLCENVFKNEPNIITVDYVVKQLKKLLVNYGFAHTTSKVHYKWYYYWNSRDIEGKEK